MPCNVDVMTMTAVEEVLTHQVNGNDMDIGAEEVTVTTVEKDGDGSSSEAVGNTMVDDILSKVPTDEAENPTEILIVEDHDVFDGSPTKRRKDSDDSMEIDENELLSPEDKENISRRIKRLPRKELEDLILVKTVEAIVKHSQAGKLRMKVSDLQAQKDRMFQRVGHLQKQVQEMSRALKLLIDNHNRDPNNLDPNKKRPPPIKFSRSVGLQVAIDPPFRNGPTKVIHVNNEQPINGLKTSTVFNVSAGQNSMRKGLKGVESPKQGNSPLQYVRMVNGQSPNSRMVMTGNGSQTSNTVKSVTKQTGAKIAMTSARTNTVANPTVVDLTDDPNANAQAGVVTAANGVQYRIVTSNANQPMQFMSSNQAYQVVSPSGQVRPFLFTQNMTPVRSQQQINKPAQALVFRNVAPKPSSPSTFAQSRPSVTVRPAGSLVSSGALPRVAATVGTMMMRAPSQVAAVQKKIQLPALPPPPPATVSVSRGRILKDIPPRPILTLDEQSDGIVLSWTMKLAAQHADILSYQIFAAQETLPSAPGKVTAWKKVGDVKALPLPMACTLSQFTQGNRYFFIVRGVDNYGRSGTFCEPAPIILQKRS